MSRTPRISVALDQKTAETLQDIADRRKISVARVAASLIKIGLETISTAKTSPPSPITEEQLRAIVREEIVAAIAQVSKLRGN